MSLIVEDGTGVASAACYATIAFKIAYFTARPQLTISATFLAADTSEQEGSSREAADFLDAQWGSYYRGVRRGFVQGRLWPRTDALDDAGYPLPDLPIELQNAECELAARALSAPLAIDLERDGKIKRIDKAVGPLRTSTEYFDAAPTQKTYGIVANMLAPLLNGSQPDAPNALWGWA